MGRLSALILGAAAIGCAPISCGSSPPPPIPPPEVRFSTAEVELPAATDAVEVIVEPDAIGVRNLAFAHTWPLADRERARRAAPPDEPRWPGFERRLVHPRDSGGPTIPELALALALARRAERDATGSSESGQYNLQIAIDVPWPEVERVIYTAGTVGYRSPRWIFDPGEHPRMLPIRTGARPEGGASQAEIARALAKIGAPTGDVPAENPIDLRVELHAARTIVRLGGRVAAPECRGTWDEDRPTFVDETSPDEILDCLQTLEPRAHEVVIEVGAEVLAGRVAEVAQHLGGGDPPVFDAIYLSSAR